MQEAKVTMKILKLVILIQFQSFVRVFFSANDLLDAGDTELLESKWVVVHGAVECSGVQQSHDHSIWYASHEDVVFEELGAVAFE